MTHCTAVYHKWVIISANYNVVPLLKGVKHYLIKANSSTQNTSENQSQKIL